VAPRPLAIFIPAWDEHAVIGAMLGHLGRTLDYPDYRVYVGVYPNDRATIAAVADAAAADARIRLVIGRRPGPTTKADCLNTLWRALLRDERREQRRVAAIVLHDAEDVVHADELWVINAYVGDHATVQLPVLPLIDPRATLISGHYADEFAEAHYNQLVVRQVLGAAMPLAGVGCAIDRTMLGRIALRQGGTPFDADSLTEDYELGMKVAAMGGRGLFVRVRPRAGSGRIVATRAYFPSKLGTAVRQKARWMTGIAFAGWDRVGWAGWSQWGDHWMRMRDRRAPLGVLVLLAAYVALVGTGASMALHWLMATPIPDHGWLLRWLLGITSGLLAWRMTMRALFTAIAHGPVQALWSLPRIFVANLVALLAARQAFTRYLRMLRGQAPRWDKTAHVFPDSATTASLVRG